MALYVISTCEAKDIFYEPTLQTPNPQILVQCTAIVLVVSVQYVGRCWRQKSSWAARHAKSLGAASALSDNLFGLSVTERSPSSHRSSYGGLYTIDPTAGLLEVVDEAAIDYPVST
jgi:hypothetical protein